MKVQSRATPGGMLRRLATPLLRPVVGARPFGPTAGLTAQAAKDGVDGKKGGKGGKKQEEGPYSASVKLPDSGFQMRANSVKREPEIQAYWDEHNVYESVIKNGKEEPFTLHDGPPYANGDLHIGHALNKILKDFINRYQLLQGRPARFIPGWDTHGLPIELKVLQSLKQEERRNLGTVELRQKAKEFALKTVDSQREQFKRYGVWGDWDTPYITLTPDYEAAQLKVFGKMLLNGHIYRGRKPVHWSPSSRTALAEAELEYPEGHKSRSIYVGMPVSKIGDKVPADLAPHMEGAAFAIWTTTPWTIPANLAIGINDKLDYAVVDVSGEGAEKWTAKRLVVAKDLIQSLGAKLGVTLTEVASFKGSVLEGCMYKHPLFDRESAVLIGGDYITTDAGTGLVHTAPGHGQEDYLVGQRYGLPLLSPVDDAGVFTEEAGQFKGMSVQGDGNVAVVTALRESGALLLEEMYEHKYPYDWRTKKPTIFRATSQWFASVDGFRTAALDNIKEVSWIPQSGINRITNMTEGRSDWCISRQRKWGVPIPVFYDQETDEAILTQESIDHVIGLVREHGADCWWTMSTEDLLPPSLRDRAGSLRKGEDTMDVWFDSGSSWAGVLETRAETGVKYPADLYLEGSDQHRGWFQSSLLTSVAANGVAPYKQVLTHGFVLDEKGMKMSKSLGNVVDPRTVIDGGKDQKKDPPYGADVLRLWVASVDYTSDVMIGGGIIKQTSEMYRKARGTLRFLLGNLTDFDPKADTVPFADLPSIDKYMLYRLSGLMEEMSKAYSSYQFYKVFQLIQRFVIVDLSNFYLDVAKDRLYIRSSTDPSRRSCQTVLNALLRGLLSALAPLVPHMADDAWINMPYKVDARSVFQAGWYKPEAEWGNLSQEDLSLWDAISTLRGAVNATMEKARTDKLIGSSLEARVQLHVSDPQLRDRLKALDAQKNGVDDLRYLFIVSQVDIVDDAALAKLAPFSETVSDATSSTASTSSGDPILSGDSLGDITVGVSRADGGKCARCWNYSDDIGQHESPDLHPELCGRCAPVVVKMGFTPPKAKEPAVV